MDTPNETPEENSLEESGGYGKRPAWQWFLIYLVVAGIIYFLVYYFFMNHGGSTGYTY